MKLTAFALLLITVSIMLSDVQKTLTFELDRVIFWNAEAKKCLEIGHVFKTTDLYDQPVFAKRGAGATVSLEDCRVRYSPSGSITSDNWNQHFNLTRIVDQRPPESSRKGFSGNAYHLSTLYNKCIVPNDEHYPRLIATDLEEDCRNSSDAIQFMVLNGRWRNGAWIQLPSRADVKEFWCLTPVPSPHTSLQVRFENCRPGNNYQYWHVCNLEADNCTQTLSKYL